jgi:sialic acid synthase SpsE
MVLRPIKIGGKLVGEGHRVYVIAEIGSNFDGDINKAKKLIRLAKECDADAVKFQSFKTELLLSEKGFEKKSAFQSRWSDSVWNTYKKAELPRQWHSELNSYAKKIGIHFFTSPWDIEAVDLLEDLNVPAIKVGSGDITYLEILKHIAGKKKPVILATGASYLKEVEDAVRAIKSSGNNQIILMHAVVQYPSPIEEANLNALRTLRQKFNLNVGYSDHSPGSLIALASVALGACVIEKHFTLDPKSKGPDHPHSMDPASFKKMIQEIRILEKSLGNGIKAPVKSERETRIIQRRGIWTIKEIKKGEKFSPENIMALRPNIGVPASEYHRIIGIRAKKNFKRFEVIRKSDL